MKRIVIIGAGGFGREVLGIVRDIGGFLPLGFVDSDPHLAGKSFDGVSVVGNDNSLKDLRASGVELAFVGVADRKILKELCALSKEIGLELSSLVHPTAYIPQGVSIGVGSVFYPGSNVMPGCLIGNGVLVNAGVTIGHDSIIGDFCNLNPGAHIAGRVTLQEGVFVGIGACVREQVTISEYAVIGAGSMVIRDVSAHTTVYGVPARQRQQSRVQR